MVATASGRRLRAGAASACVLVAAILTAPVSADAAATQPTVPPAQAPSAPGAPGSPVPALPTVGTDITDGTPVQTLYDMAIALDSAKGMTTQLQSEIAATQRDLDTAAVKARQAGDAAKAADGVEAAAAAEAKSAAAAYAGLNGALKQAILFMYTRGPVYVTVNPGAGHALAYAADYANTALTPGGLLSTRRFDASIRSAALAQASAAQQEARRQAQAATDALAAERNAEAALETELSTIASQSGPQLLAEHTALAGQAGQELLNASSLEFTPSSPIPAPLSTTNVAIGWVFSELGKNYLWGGTGPDQFDCSGLMQYAWHQAGVDIPRVAADQDSWSVPIPLSQLLPGDLVFFGQSDIHHVGMYIGDGLMINAPHTGDVVRVSSIWWSDLAGFGRVHDPNVPVPAHPAPSMTAPAVPVVLPTAGAVPSQTQPPPGWQPAPGETTPIAVDGTAAPTDSSTTTIPTSTTVPPDTTTTVAPVTTTVPSTTTSTIPVQAASVPTTLAQTGS